MDRDKNDATPLMEPHDREEAADRPAPVGTDAPESTDERGQHVDLPDRGGTLD